MKLTPQDRTIHNQFSTYGQNAKEWLRKCALLLPEIDRRRIWKKHGCESIYEYAAKVAGMSRHSVDEALWVVRKIEDKPELIKLFEQKGLRAVRPFVSMLTPATVSFWAEKGTVLPTRSLETYAKNYREELTRARKSQPESHPAAVGSKKELVQFETIPALAGTFNQLKKRADFDQVLEEFLDLLKAREEANKPQAVITSSRPIPAPIKKFVETRTSGLCAFPGCTKKGTSFHHTQRWALENIHDPDRLHLVCTAHERIAHEGLIANEEEAPENWRLKTEADPIGPKAYIDWLVGLHRQK